MAASPDLDDLDFDVVEGTVVTLSKNEMLAACQHASIRYVSAIERGAAAKRGINQPTDRTRIEFLSCMAELALAKALNLYWSGLEDIRAPDVGIFDVRATAHRSGHLLVYESDPDDQWVALVIAEPPLFRAVGCIQAKHAKVARYRKTNDRGVSYFVPQSDLRSFDAVQKQGASATGTDPWLSDLPPPGAGTSSDVQSGVSHGPQKR